MTDTAILDWIEARVAAIRLVRDGSITITWLHRGQERQTAGRDLRDAVRNAAGHKEAK